MLARAVRVAVLTLVLGFMVATNIVLGAAVTGTSLPFLVESRSAGTHLYYVWSPILLALGLAAGLVLALLLGGHGRLVLLVLMVLVVCSVDLALASMASWALEPLILPAMYLTSLLPTRCGG